MITVDLDSAIPLEEQIRQGIREAIARGEISAGQELPSVRQIAKDLGIHWNTVARAYRRLRDEGLLTVGRGRRVTVRSPAPVGDEDRRRAAALIQDKCREALTEARLNDLGSDDVKRLFAQEMLRWKTETTS